jgi:hypothetical protein
LERIGVFVHFWLDACHCGPDISCARCSLERKEKDSPLKLVKATELAHIEARVPKILNLTPATTGLISAIEKTLGPFLFEL